VLGVKFEIKKKKKMPRQFGTSHEYISLPQIQRNASSVSVSVSVDCHSYSDNSNFEYRRINVRIDNTSKNTTMWISVFPKGRILYFKTKQ